MQELQMHHALATDIPELVLLINSAYRGETSKQGWTTEADLIEGDRMNINSLTGMMEEPDVIVRKCVANNSRIVGCVCLELRHDELYISLLTVSPEIQAKGIGKLIMHDAENLARKRKLPNLALEVISVRKELMAYYIRLGFRLTGEKFEFPTDNKFGSRPLQKLELVELKKRIGK